jgi:predicted 3-demethylubiquinone-9 3-methyltransferase (glyoxalase superfamily)
METNQKISTCLWFDNNAEEAVSFYTSVFKDSKIKGITYYGEGAPLPKGTVMTISFQIEGREFLALNGGPVFKFTEAISLIVNCKDQKEIDYYWDKLAEGGSEVQCGWLKDKYGLSWQIVPAALGEMMMDKDPAKSARVMQVLMKMIKLDIATLKKAYNGE